MLNDFNLRETRNNLVAKDNRLIQHSRMALGLIEQKAILYLISKIQPDDKPGKVYIFNCKEFQALLNWSAEASYQNVKIMLQNLGDKSIWIDGEIKGRKKDILVRWFDVVRLDPGNGDLEISFHQDMLPFLIDLKKNDGTYFTTYRLQNVTLMKHRYSVRIYEILKSYQYNNKKWTFENGTGSEFDLQRRIADAVVDKKTREEIPQIPEGWANWAIFKRNILAPAVKEINKYTDIKVAYDGKKEDIYHRKTRAVRTIEFYMIGKTEPEQRETDQIIDAEYTVIEDEQKYHQMTIEEMFFEAHERSLEEARAEKELFEAARKNDQTSKSKYPVLFAELNVNRKANLDEKKINQLYNTAINGRVAGNVPRTSWELFATDLVTYYYDNIDATPEETKTTPYKRLLDSVKKDYDDQVYVLLEQYGRRVK